MGDDSEWMKLPIDQKCEHKVGSLVFGFCLLHISSVMILWYSAVEVHHS